ncbi:hypothetical protein [Embleya sp. MST-111070]|uniref:hypothetical protein n=1 Tax=Embleya sp. MST-111070 TaxID=3398231 RepID=UPI003F7342F8
MSLLSLPSPPRPPGRAGRLRTLTAAFLLAVAGLLFTAAPAHADTRVQITGSADPVPPGTGYTYTVAVGNLFSIQGGSVTLTGSAAATITNVASSNPDMPCTIDTGTSVSCTRLGRVDSDTVTVTVLPTTVGTVTASASFNDCCNTGTDSVNTTIAVPAAADIAMDLDAQPHLGILVPYLRYTATVTNNGPGAVTSATLTATLPAGKTATDLSSGCTSTPGTVTCTYGAIANGAHATSTFHLPVGILNIGHVTVTATRTASTPADNNAANDSDSATCTVVSIILATCP